MSEQEAAVVRASHAPSRAEPSAREEGRGEASGIPISPRRGEARRYLTRYPRFMPREMYIYVYLEKKSLTRDSGIVIPRASCPPHLWLSFFFHFLSVISFLSSVRVPRHILRARYSLIKIIHHLVIAAGRVDLGHQAGLQFVHEPAKDDAVPQGVFVTHTCRARNNLVTLRCAKRDKIRDTVISREEQ